jgi:hypothetical protein
MKTLHMRQMIQPFFLFLIVSLFSLGCNPIRTVRSVVPGLKSESSEPEVGEKLKLQIPPDEAVRVLDDVAAENGWYLVSVGDQQDMQGRRGKYFRLETDRFIGGRKEMAGVFFSDAAGSYVLVGKYDTGLPQELVPAFMAAVQQRSGASTVE